MANVVGLDYLPIELIYRILDCLDVQTIFHSLHGVCRRINYTLGTYNRYKFNFQSISKHKFHLIGRLILHEQVISMTLSDGNDTSNQIDLFLSSFDIKKFTISLKSLKYLSIDCRSECNAKTLRLLQSSLVGHSLQKLSLFSSSLCAVLTQNNTVNIKDLVLNSCMIRQIQQILLSSTSLETLILTDVEIDVDDDLQNIDSSSKSPKLAYLSISTSHLTMEMIVSFLNWLMKDSQQLRHLRLISDVDDETYFDGTRWESLLWTTSLTAFQFQFRAKLTTDTPIKQILLPFRNKFWLNEKRWFVACDKHRLVDQSFLYSIPGCHEHFIWRPLPSFESENTLPTNNYRIFNRVNHVHIQLNCAVYIFVFFNYHSIIDCYP
ncbi:unnamed protein product [Rotaria socialis]|uniref:F-box domain-containing protein n=1 Tax=Rotaria socialis TaxID=392032 RepID=A0A820VJT7_9BILA|nr:unnamed protein product [Rotaria socialis]CAF4502746.1 unnamed protein product [Rotaria socialis]